MSLPRLHTRARNSAGERVRIALNLKGIGYEYVAIPDLRSADYLALNPQGLMPALEVDGRVLTQSLAIIEYLEERWPQPSLHPEDPLLRAQGRAFALTIAAEVHPVTVRRVRRRLAEVHGLGEAETADWARYWTEQGLAGLEQSLRGRGFAFAFAEYPTLADIALVPAMANARRFGCDLAAWPRLVEIDARCRELEAFRRAAPEAQPDFA